MNIKRKTLDRTAAIKTIFLHLACGGYSDLPRATELYKYLSCDGEIGLTREEIKRYMIENALCDDDAFDYSDEEIADSIFGFAEDDDDEEDDIQGEAKEEIKAEETEPQTETNEEAVNEVCPHCEIEIKMRWDVKTQGYKAFCPVLGGWIMRYDACRGGCEYDGEKGTCKLSRNNTRKGSDDRNG